MTIDLDLGVIATSLVVACVTTLGSILFTIVRKQNRTDAKQDKLDSKLDRIIEALESEHPGQPGILTRLGRLEAWARDEGFERRYGSTDRRATSRNPDHRE